MIYVLGGGAGGELIIHAPAGVTVIAVNNGTGKTYSKVADASGMAVFKGLPEETYSVHIEQSGNTTDPIQVNVAYKSSATITWFSATIKVTYPAGSTCTCTYGGYSYTAGDTSGSWTFTVPVAGTWTVTVTNGSQTRTKTVSITTNGQSVSVGIIYELYLFNKGDTCLADTGGWTNTTTGGVTSGYVSGTDLVWHADSGGIGYYRTVYAIDVTPYSTLYVNITSTTVTNTDRSRIAVWNAAETIIATLNVPSTGTLSIDVRSITGKVRIGASYHSNMTTRANLIWLTP